MKLALSEISTVGASFAEDVAAYAAAGLDGIGIWEFKLPDDDEANLALTGDAGLDVANCVPTVPSILQLFLPGIEGPPDPEERIESICSSVRRLARYEPECVLFLSGPIGPRGEDEARAIVIDGLRRIFSAAREAGVRVGFEPIHPSQGETTSFVNSTAAADALLRAAGLPDGCLFLDTYNLWDDAGAEAWIAANPTRIAGVHVADHPGNGRTDRVLPGEGGNRSRALVEALRAAGWDGYLDAEIFSEPDRFWALPVEEAARRARAALASLLG